MHCLLICLQVRPPGPLHSDSGGQDPFVDLGLGWFAMGLGVGLGSSFVPFGSFFLCPPCWFPLLLLLLLSSCRRRSVFVALRVSCFSPLVCAGLLRVLRLFFWLGCAWGVFFLFISQLLKRVCVCFADRRSAACVLSSLWSPVGPPLALPVCPSALFGR